MLASWWGALGGSSWLAGPSTRGTLVWGHVWVAALGDEPPLDARWALPGVAAAATHFPTQWACHLRSLFAPPHPQVVEPSWRAGWERDSSQRVAIPTYAKKIVRGS